MLTFIAIVEAIRLFIDLLILGNLGSHVAVVHPVPSPAADKDGDDNLKHE